MTTTGGFSTKDWLSVWGWEVVAGLGGGDEGSLGLEVSACSQAQCLMNKGKKPSWTVQTLPTECGAPASFAASCRRRHASLS